MSNVIDFMTRLSVLTDDEVPPNGAVYWDAQSVSDDLNSLASHISAIAGLLQRDLLGPEQIANNLTRLIGCATRAAVRTKKLETKPAW